MTKRRTSLNLLGATLTVFAGLSTTGSAQQMPTTTTERIKGAPSVNTDVIHGTIVNVEGNTLVVRMLGGDLREFNVPESRKFLIDGQELSVHELKPGTRLTATVTTITTPVTERTTTVGSGKVFFVSGRTVILTLPNNENRMYKVEEHYNFNVNGQPATVHDLRKGMIVSAQKIVESPTTEIAANTTVTGHAPPEPRQPAAVASAAAPAPAPAPAREEVAPAQPAPAPAEPATGNLPQTGTQMPLVGLLGLLFLAAGFLIGRLRIN